MLQIYKRNRVRVVSKNVILGVFSNQPFFSSLTYYQLFSINFNII